MTINANAPLADLGLTQPELPLPLLLGNASAAVVQLDPQGRVQLWNQASEKLFGWQRDEVLGKPSPAIPNDLWEDNQAWFLRCLGGQTMSGIQLKRRRKDGTTINVHAWAWPVRNEHGLILGVMMMFFPVGERSAVQNAPGDLGLKQKTEQAQRFHSVLVSLGKTDHPSLDSALQTLSTVSSQTLNVERVSIWLFNEARDAINCSCLYQRTPGTFETGKTLTAQDYPRYFESLQQSRTIAAGDACKDPRTSEYRKDYLEPLGIASMLDVPIRLHGREIGIVCHEHIGSVRNWSHEEQAFAAAIADFVSLSYENQEHAKAERALRESQATLHSFVESATARLGLARVAANNDLQLIWGNTALSSAWPSLQADRLLSESQLQQDLTDRWRQAAQDALRQKQAVRFELREAGSEQWLEFCLTPVEHSNGHIEQRVSFIIVDKSEFRRLEEQLQQTQRLESLGLLAGTIAHDFNGLLTAIYGFLDLAQNELPTTHMARTYLQSGLQAALRATDLTQQLLAYAGKGKREIKSFDLSALVLEVTELLRSILKQHGSLQLDLSPSLPDTSGDMTQIRQLVMNLISNAAESQSGGHGIVSIKTDVVTVHESELMRCQVMSPDVSPGPYVMLQVSDQGCGIAPDVLKRIFDPFFTTKSTGRGLGLAASVGIVRSHKAALMVESHIGKGTTFKVYLPVVGLS